MGRRLWAVLHSHRLDRELNDEIETHLAMQEEELRRQGMDAAAARRAARREFGGVAQTQEAYRERRGIPWLESAAKDLFCALRGLRRSPGFAAAAVISLALGIGANTAIFSLFHTLMLRMLPVARPAQLLTMYRTGGWGKGFASYPLYLEIAKRTDLFNGVVARSGVRKVRLAAAAGDRAEFVYREYVSGNYFTVLGVPPALGRLISDEDNRVPRSSPVAVLSYDFWRRRFGADPTVVGRKLVIDEQPLTVVGVARPGFRGIEVEHHADVWVPAMMARIGIMAPGNHWVWIVARRKPEVSRQQVQAAVDAVFQHHLAAVYGSNGDAAFRRFAMDQHLEVREGGVGLSLLREAFGKPLTVLMAAVGLVLLAACANVANLLVARGAARQREVALRYSLGATRGRLVRQSLIECLLLAGSGAAMGILLAWWGAQALLRFLPTETTEPLSTVPDLSVLAFTLAISLASALLFGLVPAMRSTAVDPAAGLRTAIGQARSGRPVLRRSLVIVQVALSVVLVVLAGVFGRTLAELRSVELGFHNLNTIAFDLDFPSSWKKDQVREWRQRFQGRLESLAGVTSVSYAFPGPFSNGDSTVTIRIPGSPAAGNQPVEVNVVTAAPRYFETIGNPPLVGREFDRNDTATSRKVALVNQAFARRYFPGDPNPLGRVVSFDDSQEGGAPTFIAGVVHDMRSHTVRDKLDPTVYVPAAQMPSDFEPTFVVRAAAPAVALAPALRRELERLGPQVAINEPRTIRQRIDDSIFQERMMAALSEFFGVLALLLAAVGLYGVLAYGTAQRTGEIGVRMALGARRAAVLWMVFRDALVLVAAGLAVGLPCALAATHGAASVLVGIEPAQAIYLWTVAVLLAAGLAAAFLPARRAASVDPATVLRHE